MGSSARDYYDRLDEEARQEEFQKKAAKRRAFVEEVKEMKYTEDIEWLWENKEKIIRNKKLIDLLG